MAGGCIVFAIHGRDVTTVVHVSPIGLLELKVMSLCTQDEFYLNKGYKILEKHDTAALPDTLYLSEITRTTLFNIKINKTMFVVSCMLSQVLKSIDDNNLDHLSVKKVNSEVNNAVKYV